MAFMFAGASWGLWLGFHAAVVLLLTIDAMLPVRKRETSSQPMAWLWTGVLVAAAAAFATWIGVAQGRHAMLEWLAGYTIETSLSVDNLFVFLVIFQGFRVSPRRQHRALLWGIAGAVMLRAGFIAAGVTLMNRFDWVTWIFGLFLLYASFRVVQSGSPRSALPEWIRRLQPAQGSLLPVILAVEFTDLLFAVDSIPAVLAVSHDPFVVYTSNITAILGLRSLYFALASMLDRFRYLHYGLGALLGFVGLKMLAAPWFDVPITISLIVIGAILAICAVGCWTAPKKENKKGISVSES